MDANLLNKLAEQGLIALLLAISLLANFFLYKETRSIQDKRIEDLKEGRDALLGPMESVKQTVNLILTLLQTKRK